ncbi:MAG: ComEC/Rec2 family competence protein [Spirochaetaceae bacterium]|nr:ComEC/Rec2 family competence protein [Spirochaetaceae bacterium]
MRPLAVAAAGACLSYYGVVPWAGGFVFAVLACGGLVLAVLARVVCGPPVLPVGGDLPRAARYALTLVLFLVCGFWTGGTARWTAEQNARFSTGQARSGVTALSGVLLDDPRTARSGQGLAVLSLRWADGTVAGIRGAVRTSARGSVTVLFPEGSIPRVKEFGRGSMVLLEGRFTEDGGLFVAKGVFVSAPPSKINRLRTAARVACVDFFAPYRWGGLALALLIGIRDNLDSELSAQYQNAGVSYILALSGMHLAIISAVLAFLLKRPFGLKGAAATGSLIIIGYIFIVGAQPSLERAGIMYLLGAVAVILGLPVNPRLTLCFSFLLQLVINPASGMSISFVLSYGALAGILTMSKPVYNWFRPYLPSAIGTPLAASLAAFIATLAVTAGFFGEIRPVGILSGLPMGPLTTVFMIGAICFPLMPPPLKPFADRAMRFLYALLEKIAFAAGRVPPVPAAVVPALVVNIALVAGLVAVTLYIMKRRYFFDRKRLEL